MALRDFKVLTFDVVGTLIDFEGGMLAYLRQAVPGSDVTDEQFLAAYRAARKSPDTDWYPNDLVRCWHVVAPQLGLPDSDALAQGFRDSVAQWPAFPDSIEALARLRKQPEVRANAKDVGQWRRNGAGAQILADLGLGRLRVLGTPRRQVGLAGFGLDVVEYVAAG